MAERRRSSVSRPLPSRHLRVQGSDLPTVRSQNDVLLVGVVSEGYAAGESGGGSHRVCVSRVARREEALGRAGT